MPKKSAAPPTGDPVDSEKRHRVALRVRDLRRLARGTPSPEEAQAANALADRLVEQYGLTEAEIPPTEDPPRSVQAPPGVSGVPVAPFPPGMPLQGILERLAVQAGLWYVERKFGLDVRSIMDDVEHHIMAAAQTDAERAVAAKVCAAVKEWIS